MEQLEVFRSQWGEATDVWLNQVRSLRAYVQYTVGSESIMLHTFAMYAWPVARFSHAWMSKMAQYRHFECILRSCMAGVCIEL
jgi:hypothetical protein